MKERWERKFVTTNEDLATVKKVVSLMSREDEPIGVVLDLYSGTAHDFLPIMNEVVIREYKFSQTHKSKETG